MKKIPAYNLQEMLIVLAIIGILLLIAMPSFMPLITKAKSMEAQIHLKAIHNSQKSYYFIHNQYSKSLHALDYEHPKSKEDGGTANYRYEITSVGNNNFKAQATAVVDFDGDGVFNIWEIDREGVPIQIQKD